MIANDIEVIKKALDIDPQISLNSNPNLIKILEDSPEDSTTEPELLDVLYSIIRSKRTHTVVEIGTFKGIASLIFSEALRENNYGKIYTIDNGSLIGNKIPRTLFKKNNLENIVFIEKDSVSAFESWGRAEIDLLYIDGDHSYSSTCIDFALWSRFVTKRGLIVIHDTRTRLLRHFPDDYIYPLDYYNILVIDNVQYRPSGQEWEGCAFITKGNQADQIK